MTGAGDAGPDPVISFIDDGAGRSIACAASGSGPLVLCPPWWVSHVQKDWDHEGFRSFFRRLGEGFTLVRYDRPGVGLSDRSATATDLDEEERLLGTVADRFGSGSYGIFAMSCGGPVAIRHAARRPGRVDRICFYGSFVDGAELGTPELQQALLAIISAHWGVASKAISDIFFPDASKETMRAMARLTRDSASAEAATRLMKLTFGMNAEEAAGLVAARCLVIHREGDRAVPFEAGRTLASRLPHATFATARGSNHPAWMDGLEIAGMANAFLHGMSPVPFVGHSAMPPFDRDNRTLDVDGRPVGLTRLEYLVLCELVDHEGGLVTRDQLLHNVWKQSFEGSNRIDVVIRSLRRKLGSRAEAIATVIGHGYRFVGWQHPRPEPAADTTPGEGPLAR